MSRRVETLPVNKKGKLLDEYGREVVSSIPMAPPVGFTEQPSMSELIDAKIRAALAAQAEARELDAEENDFDDPWLDDEENEGFTRYEFAAAAYDTVLANPHRATNPRPPLEEKEPPAEPATTPARPTERQQDDADRTERRPGRRIKAPQFGLERVPDQETDPE